MRSCDFGKLCSALSLIVYISFWEQKNLKILCICKCKVGSRLWKIKKKKEEED